MTPVINPWVFYWISILDDLDSILKIATILSLIIIIWILFGKEDCEESDLEFLKKTVKYMTITFFVSLFLIIFIPSSETITKMIVAQNVTYERIETTTDTVQTVYEDIMELFKENENNKKK